LQRSVLFYLPIYLKHNETLKTGVKTAQNGSGVFKTLLFGLFRALFSTRKTFDLFVFSCLAISA